MYPFFFKCPPGYERDSHRYMPRVLVLIALVFAIAFTVPARAFAATVDINQFEKNGTAETIQLNGWKTGNFTNDGSTTRYWFPDVYKFTITQAGTYSILAETQNVYSGFSGLVFVLTDSYTKGTDKTTYNPLAWFSFIGEPMSCSQEVTLNRGTYWLMVGDAHDIYVGLDNPGSYTFDVDPFSDEIHDFINNHPKESYLGTYRIGVFKHPSGALPVYRMYNKRTSEHLYTKSISEYNSCGVGNYRDWRGEGIAWFAPKSSSTPVYRLYNRGLLVHHYTSSRAERDMLVRKHGWRYEGVAFYSDDAHGVPLYRLYNGSIRPSQHHYTSSAGERDTLMYNYGWDYEGVNFYGVRQ